MPVGTGSTVTFAGWSGKILSVDWSGVKVETYDDSDMSTVKWKEFEAKSLADGGEFTLDCKWRSDMTFPSLRTRSTLVITTVGGKNLSCFAIFTEVKVKIAMEDDMTGTLVFKATKVVTGAPDVATGAINV